MSQHVYCSKLVQEFSLMRYGSRKHVSVHGCMKGKLLRMCIAEC